MKTLLQGGTLIYSDKVQRADILIEGEKIAAIGQNLSADTILDVSGCLIFPGFIDGHTHLDMPVSGTVTADDFATGSASALVGGTTTLIDFATQDRGSSLQQAYDIWHKRADGKCSCDFAFHMAITDWNDATKEELSQMISYGISSFKCYFAYDALMVSDAQLYEILCAVKQLGGVVGLHCENGPVIQHLQKKALQAGQTSPKFHPKTRPAYLEGEAVSRFLRLAALADAPAWVVHLSSQDGLQEIRLARQRGQKVYVETCPQYLIMDESVYESDGFESAKYICSPPMRSKQDVMALWEAVQNGEIDIISTDHCSFDFHGQKEMGKADFTKVPNGLPGLEHRPTVMYTAGVGSGKISQSDLCRLLAENPAKMFGLFPQKGILSVGSDADIVVYNPNQNTVISAKTQVQHCDYTPYEGMNTVGCVQDVFLRGKLVVKNGKLVQQGMGMYLMRKKPG